MYYQQTQMGQAIVPDSNPSCQNLLFQPFTFSHQSPPPMINITDQPVEVLKYAPDLAIAIGNVICKNANVNAAYRYLFNNLAQAGWNHPEWEPIVRFGLGLLWKFMLSRQGASPQSLIEESANSGVMYKASFYATQAPAVFNNLDQPTRVDVQRLAQEHELLRGEFSQMSASYLDELRRHTNPAAMQQAYGGITGQVMADRIAGVQQATVGVLASMANAFQQPGGHLPQQPYGLLSVGATVTMDDVRNKMLQPVAHKAKRGAVLDSIEDATPRAPAAAPAQAAAPAPAAAASPFPIHVPATPAPASVPSWAVDAMPRPIDRPTTVVEMTGGETSIKPVQAAVLTDQPWAPSPSQLYLPAIDTVATKMQYEVIQPDNGGAPIVLGTVVAKTEEEMNRDEYAIPTFDKSLRDALRAQIPGDTAKQVMTDIDLINKAKATLRVREDEKETELLKGFGIELQAPREHATIGEVHSMDEAIYAARRLRLAHEGTPSIFQVTGKVVNRFLFAGDNDDAGLIGNANNFAELATQLNELIDARKDSIETLTTLFQLNGYFTNEFNFMLHTLMGLHPDVRIDSFREDYEAMLTGLTDAFGRSYSQAAVNSQVGILAKMMGDIGIAEIFTDKEGDEGKKVGAELIFTRNMTVTLLASTRHELGFDYPLGEAFELFDTTYPGLHAFADQLLSDEKTQGEHYLVTADGSVYGLERSIMGHKPVVIYAMG